MTHHPYDDVSLESLRARPGAKWQVFPGDVLPLWVAEMDFPIADSIKQAIGANLSANDLGYTVGVGVPGLRDAVAERLTVKHGLPLEPDQVALLPTTGVGLGLAARAFAGPGDEVLLLTPLYPPFKHAVENAGRVPVEVELVNGDDGYSIDFGALEAAVSPASRLLMLCSPHNPVGKVFTREELERLADFALRHNLWVVSDELHADLLFDGKHVPIASISPEIGARTVTLYGPTKAFNIPGLKISFAASSNPGLLERLSAAGKGLVPAPNVLAQVATVGAYRGGSEWLAYTLDYLRGNRELVVSFVNENLTGVGLHVPAATYLAWLDLRSKGLGDKPAAPLAERAKVGLNEGADFGLGGAGFVRLNFATSRPILRLALERLATVLGEPA